MKLTTTGFLLLDASGKTVAHVDCFAEALYSMNRRYDAAEQVRRVSDGVVLANKVRLKGESFWVPLWRGVMSGAIA